MHYKGVKDILLPRGNGSFGMNPYRGCTHGCIYCDARSKCYQMQHPFEDVEVKRNAPELLENALRRKRERCMIGTGAMCDPYLPLEAEEQITLRCATLIEQYGFGLSIHTKSDFLLRDLDLLKRINEKTKCVVQTTLTTLDEDLCRIVEPHVCTTARRAEMLKTLQKESIPTVVWISPILPFINDTEKNLRGLLRMCFEADVKGIICFGMGVTLREGDRAYFYEKLDAHFPGMKQRYIQAFGNSYVCNSPNHKVLMQVLGTECKQQGVLYRPENVFAYLETFEDKRAGEQLCLL